MAYDTLTYFKDITNLALTSVLTIATVMLAIYTWKLVDESRRMRQEQVRPNISVYFQHAETDPTLMFIVVENNGTGAAYNVKFRISKDIKDYTRSDGSGKIAPIGIFKNGMKYCPSGFFKKYFLLETMNNYHEKMEEQLVFTVTYSNSLKQSITETFHLAVNEFSQWSTISPSDTYIGRIAGSLKDINDKLDMLIPTNKKNLIDM